jgi:hypothetical protein
MSQGSLNNGPSTSQEPYAKFKKASTKPTLFFDRERVAKVRDYKAIDSETDEDEIDLSFEAEPELVNSQLYPSASVSHARKKRRITDSESD